jgi:putative hydrolase of HD superfamily
MEIDKMKSVYRRTLVSDRSRCETDAEHSWHFAMSALILREYSADKNIDIFRVVCMALVHDLVEIYAGDTFAYDAEGNKDKNARERESADKLYAMLPEDQGAFFRELWEEFDAMETPDALYASAIDRLQPFISNYMTEGHTWVENNIKTGQIFTRMKPIEKAMPKLWEFIEQAVGEAREKGQITD